MFSPSWRDLYGETQVDAGNRALGLNGSALCGGAVGVLPDQSSCAFLRSRDSICRRHYDDGHDYSADGGSAQVRCGLRLGNARNDAVMVSGYLCARDWRGGSVAGRRGHVRKGTIIEVAAASVYPRPKRDLVRPTPSTTAQEGPSRLDLAHCGGNGPDRTPAESIIWPYVKRSDI